ncbi:glucan endo-1,3-beta-glucosidase 1-like [Phalaenopsis equestris]|uniref:glucan endo-1,3-beta-glucosidase 1-like n=1 Tax=Phalaenopsis equestris TaxID=78828 RepID=UPI0009E5E65E|nr:glucan endo-1,3-beta-glucosidase 1-like [Phalaenopsis equestris]XP_020589389.1 glucan endo-1,3-beta-glucosidase 1-like [Phalaenopsis equestris]
MASTLSILLFILFFPLLTPAANSGDNNGTSAGGGGEPPFVGVVIGDEVSALLPPADLARFLLSQRITHVRLANPSLPLLAALNSTGVRILITIPNSLLLAFASSPSSASSWVSRFILPFITSISAIAVGDDFSASISTSILLPALRSICYALSGLQSHIPISTPLPFSIILNPFPPSQAFFNQTLTPNFLLPLLTLLSSTNSPFMLNLYPYYSFMRSRGVIPLDSALFKPLPPSKEEIDPNTLLHYTNLFDAMLDAARFALRSLNFSHIPILVTETGWPSAGDSKTEPFATKDNADTYNSNLIKHVVVDRAGTPLVPEQTASVYIYELFNEDERVGLESEKHWGLFYGNGTPVYLLNVVGSGGFLANDSTNRTFCVAAEGTDTKALQAALDWACGPGRANCSEIQPGEGCYDPNNVRQHASYAFDSYYQSEGKIMGSCYFQGAAMVTTTDPSHGDCIFPGSVHVSSITKTGSNTTESSSAEEICCWRFRRGMREGSFNFSIVRRTIIVLLMIYFNFLPEV